MANLLSPAVLQDGACASCEDSGGPLYLLFLGMLGLLVGHPAENTNRPPACPGFALLFLCRTVENAPFVLVILWRSHWHHHDACQPVGGPEMVGVKLMTQLGSL